MNNVSIYDPFRFIDEFWHSRAPMWKAESFPPFNIKQLDDETRVLELATAGFTRDELTIEVKQNLLTISGEKTQNTEDNSDNYLHKGIAARKFARTVALWEFWEVDSADYQDGILSITMKRHVPESAKPRSISIGAGSERKKLTK
jgi:molecular chaperone IbpA